MNIIRYLPMILCLALMVLRIAFATIESSNENYPRAAYEMIWAVAHLICLFGYAAIMYMVM